MILELTTDFFDFYNRFITLNHVDLVSNNYHIILVNPVNCKGISGKGMALEFKTKFPENHESYAEYCKNELLQPGEIYEYFAGFNLGYPVSIFNLATKDDWRNPSKLEWISLGIDNLNKLLLKDEKKCIVFMTYPGCGNGGLDKKEVAKIITDKLSALEGHKIILLTK